MKKKSRLDCETTKAATLIAAGGGRLPGAAKGWPAGRSKQISAPGKLQKLFYYRFNYRLSIVMG